MPRHVDQLTNKRMDLEQAVATLEPGGSVLLNSAASFPMRFVEGVVSEGDRLAPMTIMHAMRREPWELTVDYVNDPNFVHVSDFTFDVPIREAVREGRAEFRPNHPHEGAATLARVLDDSYVFVSAASPPDSHGYFSLGPFGGWGIPFVRNGKAKRILLEVNPHQPRVQGDVSLHISQIDGYFDVEYPLRADALSIEPTPTETSIAENVVSLIEDESTLQFGAGVVPDQIAKLLVKDEKRHLGIHSEAIFDSVVELVEAGVVDNSAKSIHRGKCLVSMSLGSPRLYDFLNDNPAVDMRPMSYVNDPHVIAQNHKQVAINAAVQIDLLGQVASETIGPVHYSGTGGQWEFIFGASHSPGGKGIIVLPSTAKSGSISTITGGLASGTAVTVPRNDVDYVVTEHGIASLKGHTMSNRARQLIAIAHPDFRADLENQAKELRIL